MHNPFPENIYKARTTERRIDFRGDYFRDQTAIIHSTAFRRLKHKTQVFFAPENDHICTRIEHVLHVATIAAAICKGLNNYENWILDADIAYAIGLGHDIGHTPFGHAGEVAFCKILGSDDAFIHEINSYRQVEYLANNGDGLNLCFAVKDGIICHNGEKDEQYLSPITVLNKLDEIKKRNAISNSYEGCITRFSDKIAYLGRDIEDAIVAGFIAKNDIPNEIAREIGQNNGHIINSLIFDLIENSKDKKEVGFSDEKYNLILKLKKFNSERIYNHIILKDYDKFCSNIIENLFEFLMKTIEKYGFDLPLFYDNNIELTKNFCNYISDMKYFYLKEKTPATQIVIDYIAGMTDLFALEAIKQITIPKPIIFK
jgi:dGTPase